MITKSGGAVPQRTELRVEEGTDAHAFQQAFAGCLLTSQGNDKV